MSVRCFMVEQSNERTVTIPAHPCTCKEGCDYVWEAREEALFDIRRVDTGEILQADVSYMGGLPPGAMYWREFRASDDRPTAEDDYGGDAKRIQTARGLFADRPESYSGACASDPTLPKRQPTLIFADGPVLEVICPNGHPWLIDSRASNCTMPYDYEHRCWIRHGEPPDITVDKNGQTCQAGAGSIQAGDYHGFLQNGAFT